MARSATIQARIDPDIKSKAQQILKTLNISMSEAISIYLTQVTLHQGIPFEVRIPNELTSKTLRKAEAGEDLNAVHSVDELFEELDR
ncbi:MAG: type II toxin-antitoxin system RelB/DinJ family antitoxin [Candidatus Latescibacteria bacterium]|nr:type II toxin-antitoxin system RelB/DinJ family antitoxin [Candidatus Latescibacterota bacterium]